MTHKHLAILASIAILIFTAVAIARIPNVAPMPREANLPHTAATPHNATLPTSGETNVLFNLTGAVVAGVASGNYSGSQTFTRASGGLEGTVSTNHMNESWTLTTTNVLRQVTLDSIPYIFIEGQRSHKVQYNYERTLNWATYNCTLTLVTDDESSPYSKYAFKGEYSGLGNGAYNAFGHYVQTAPTKFTRSVYSNGVNNNKFIRRIYDGFNNVTEGEINSTLCGCWQRYINTFVTTESSDVYIFYMMTHADNPVQTIYFTLMQLEQAEFASSPIPNSTTGTVTRAADSLHFATASNINAQHGNLELCAFTEYGFDDLSSVSGDTYFLKAGTDFSIYFDESENKITFAAGGQTASIATTFAAYTDFCIAATWQNGDKLKIKLNDGAWQYSSGNYSTATLDASMYIGSATSSTGHLFGGIRELKIEE